MSTTARQVLTDEQLEQYQRDGYFIARGLFSPEEMQMIREHFKAIHAQAPIPGYETPVPLDQTGGDLLKHYPRIMQPHRFDEASKNWMLDPRLECRLRDLLGEQPIAAQSMFYFKPPGARGQALHQDNFYLRVKPDTCLAAWLAVDDADQGNGGLFIVPGTHRTNVQCPHPADLNKSFSIEEVDIPNGMQPIRADLKAGDVLFFNGSVIHGSNPNSSPDRFRRSFICHYVPESTVELNESYRLVDFDGNAIQRNNVSDGGPCGTEEIAVMRQAVKEHEQLSAAGRLQGALA